MSNIRALIAPPAAILGMLFVLRGSAHHPEPELCLRPWPANRNL